MTQELRMGKSWYIKSEAIGNEKRKRPNPFSYSLIGNKQVPKRKF